MDELRQLLSGFAPTFLLTLNGTPPVGITYQMYLGQDRNFEGGAPMHVRESYRVTLWQKKNDPDQVTAIQTALRAQGWAIHYWTQMYDNENKYIMYPMNIMKLRCVSWLTESK